MENLEDFPCASNLGNYIVDAPSKEGAQWAARPHQLVSLDDMMQVYAERYIQIGSLLESISAYAKSVFLPHSPMKVEQRDWIVSQLDILKSYTAPLEMLSTDLIEDLSLRFRQSIPSWAEARLELDNITRAIVLELKKRLFLYLSPEEAKYLVPPESMRFNEEFRDNFGSAHADAKSAFYCIAFDQYTASVFHSMRVVEKGLNAMALAFSVSFQLENWQTIIEQIEAKVKDLKNLPKGQQKSDDQKFYSEAAKEFYYFKDAWRNHVMHGKATYDKPDAERILEHVRHFMGHLAKRLKE